MKNYNFVIPANSEIPLAVEASFFRIKEATGAVTIKCGQGNVLEMEKGDKVRLPELVEEIRIINNTASQITGKILVGNGDADSSASNGSVSIEQGATITDTVSTSITGAAAAVELLAANASRKSIRFMNRTTTTKFYIGAAGVDATKGIEIGVGESWIETEGAAAAWYVYADVTGTLVTQEIE